MMNFYNERNKTGSVTRQGDYTTTCICIDMHVDALISDSATNQRLKRIRNKLTSKKELTGKEKNLLIELDLIY